LLQKEVCEEGGEGGEGLGVVGVNCIIYKQEEKSGSCAEGLIG